MNTFAIGLSIGFFLSVILAVIGNRAAYHNGVVDGYGFCREPDCPGYWRAGKYLCKYMVCRWHELDAYKPWLEDN